MAPVRSMDEGELVSLDEQVRNAVGECLSSIQDMTIDELNDIYRQQNNGMSIPYDQLGYQSLQLYLDSIGISSHHVSGRGYLIIAEGALPMSSSTSSTGSSITDDTNHSTTHRLLQRSQSYNPLGATTTTRLDGSSSFGWGRGTTWASYDDTGMHATGRGRLLNGGSGDEKSKGRVTRGGVFSRSEKEDGGSGRGQKVNRDSQMDDQGGIRKDTGGRCASRNKMVKSCSYDDQMEVGNSKRVYSAPELDLEEMMEDTDERKGALDGNYMKNIMGDQDERMGDIRRDNDKRKRSLYANEMGETIDQKGISRNLNGKRVLSNVQQSDVDQLQPMFKSLTIGDRCRSLSVSDQPSTSSSLQNKQTTSDTQLYNGPPPKSILKRTSSAPGSTTALHVNRSRSMNSGETVNADRKRNASESAVDNIATTEKRSRSSSVLNRHHRRSSRSRSRHGSPSSSESSDDDSEESDSESSYSDSSSSSSSESESSSSDREHEKKRKRKHGSKRRSEKKRKEKTARRKRKEKERRSGKSTERKSKRSRHGKGSKDDDSKRDRRKKNDTSRCGNDSMNGTDDELKLVKRVSFRSPVTGSPIGKMNSLPDVTETENRRPQAEGGAQPDRDQYQLKPTNKTNSIPTTETTPETPRNRHDHEKKEKHRQREKDEAENKRKQKKSKKEKHHEKDDHGEDKRKVENKEAEKSKRKKRERLEKDETDTGNSSVESSQHRRRSVSIPAVTFVNEKADSHKEYYLEQNVRAEYSFTSTASGDTADEESRLLDDILNTHFVRGGPDPADEHEQCQDNAPSSSKVSVALEKPLQIDTPPMSHVPHINEGLVCDNDNYASQAANSKLINKYVLALGERISKLQIGTQNRHPPTLPSAAQSSDAGFPLTSKVSSIPNRSTTSVVGSHDNETKEKLNCLAQIANKFQPQLPKSSSAESRSSFPFNVNAPAFKPGMGVDCSMSATQLGPVGEHGTAAAVTSNHRSVQRSASTPAIPNYEPIPLRRPVLAGRNIRKPPPSDTSTTAIPQQLQKQSLLPSSPVVVPSTASNIQPESSKRKSRFLVIGKSDRRSESKQTKAHSPSQNDFPPAKQIAPTIGTTTSYSPSSTPVRDSKPADSHPPISSCDTVLQQSTIGSDMAKEMPSESCPTLPSRTDEQQCSTSTTQTFQSFVQLALHGMSSDMQSRLPFPDFLTFPPPADHAHLAPSHIKVSRHMSLPPPNLHNDLNPTRPPRFVKLAHAPMPPSNCPAPFAPTPPNPDHSSSKFSQNRSVESANSQARPGNASASTPAANSPVPVSSVNAKSPPPMPRSTKSSPPFVGSSHLSNKSTRQSKIISKPPGFSDSVESPPEDISCVEGGFIRRLVPAVDAEYGYYSMQTNVPPYCIPFPTAPPQTEALTNDMPSSPSKTETATKSNKKLSSPSKSHTKVSPCKEVKGHTKLQRSMSSGVVGRQWGGPGFNRSGRRNRFNSFSSDSASDTSRRGTPTLATIPQGKLLGDISDSSSSIDMSKYDVRFEEHLLKKLSKPLFDGTISDNLAKEFIPGDEMEDKAQKAKEEYDYEKPRSPITTQQNGDGQSPGSYPWDRDSDSDESTAQSFDGKMTSDMDERNANDGIVERGFRNGNREERRDVGFRRPGDYAAIDDDDYLSEQQQRWSSGRSWTSADTSLQQRHDGQQADGRPHRSIHDNRTNTRFSHETHTNDKHHGLASTNPRDACGSHETHTNDEHRGRFSSARTNLVGSLEMHTGEKPTATNPRDDSERIMLENVSRLIISHPFGLSATMVEKLYHDAHGKYLPNDWRRRLHDVKGNEIICLDKYLISADQS